MPFTVDGQQLTMTNQADGMSGAAVLHNTRTQGGTSTITDPTSGDTIRLVGITEARLAANPGDFSFHG